MTPPEQVLHPGLLERARQHAGRRIQLGLLFCAMALIGNVEEGGLTSILALLRALRADLRASPDGRRADLRVCRADLRADLGDAPFL